MSYSFASVCPVYHTALQQVLKGPSPAHKPGQDWATKGGPLIARRKAGRRRRKEKKKTQESVMHFEFDSDWKKVFSMTGKKKLKKNKTKQETRQDFSTPEWGRESSSVFGNVCPHFISH